jgi:hypothetical protein
MFFYTVWKNKRYKKTSLTAKVMSVKEGTRFFWNLNFTPPSINNLNPKQ